MINKDYEYLDHTADAKFRAYGTSFEQAIANAAYAMTDLSFPHNKVTAKNGKRVEAVGRTRETLIYEFFQSIIFLLETQGFVLARIDDMTIEKTPEGRYRLQCRLVGDETSRYALDNHIKSATYSEMEITEIDGKWMIQAVVDI